MGPEALHGRMGAVLVQLVILVALSIPQVVLGQTSTSVHLDQLRPPRELELVGEPLVSIGDGSSPQYELFQVGDAVRLADGRIAVLNGGTNEVRVYSPEGRFAVTLGGMGEGPGEFMGAVRLFRGLADSLVVWDGRSVRASVFTVDGGFARTIPLDPRPQAPRLEGVDERGRLLVVAAHFGPSTNPEITRLTESWMLYDAAGRLIDTLGTSPGMAGVVRGTAERMELLKPLIAPTTTYAMGGSMLWIETGESRRLERFNLAARDSQVITWDGPDLSMSPAYQKAIVEDLVKAVPDERQSGYRASLERRPVPKTIPATRRVLADSVGRGWLELAPTPGRSDRVTWIVFGTNGTPEARLVLPSNVSLQSVLSSAVLLIERDEFAVEHVKLYRLSGL